MSNPLALVEGHLHSPYFIFLRAAGRYSDAQILQFLGLDGFVPSPPVEDGSAPHVCFTEDEDWVHIADDWFYSLWHRGHRALEQRLHRSLPEIPIFACSVGDSDSSFHFSYYSEGRLQRRLHVEDPQYDRNRRVVYTSKGDSLRGEKPLLEVTDEQNYVLSFAAALGVNLNHNLDSFRCYSGPPKGA